MRLPSCVHASTIVVTHLSCVSGLYVLPKQDIVFAQGPYPARKVSTSLAPSPSIPPIIWVQTLDYIILISMTLQSPLSTPTTGFSLD